MFWSRNRKLLNYNLLNRRAKLFCLFLLIFFKQKDENITKITVFVFEFFSFSSTDKWKKRSKRLLTYFNLGDQVFWIFKWKNEWKALNFITANDNRLLGQVSKLQNSAAHVSARPIELLLTTMVCHHAH